MAVLEICVVHVDALSQRPIPNSRILERGAGPGKPSGKIVESHPTAMVTVCDFDPTPVSDIAAGELGDKPGLRPPQAVDATAIDAEDGIFDVVVWTLAFLHLLPLTGARALVAPVRVGRTSVGDRPQTRSPVGLIVTMLAMMPVVVAMIAVPTNVSGRLRWNHQCTARAYSRAAFANLGNTTKPHMCIEFLASPWRFSQRNVAVL